MQIIGIGGRRKSGKDTIGSMLVDGYGFQRVALADRLKQLAHLIFDFDEQQLFGTDAEKAAPDPRGARDSYWHDVEESIDVFGTELREVSDVENAPDLLLEAVNRYIRPLGANLSARKALQFMGTEWRDACGKPNMWVDWTFGDIERLSRGHRTYSPMHGIQSVSYAPALTHFVITDVRFPHEVKAVHDHGGESWFVDAEERLGPLDSKEHASEPRIELFRPIVCRVIDNNGSLDTVRAHVTMIARRAGW
jgi:hypothetical protein